MGKREVVQRKCDHRSDLWHRTGNFVDESPEYLCNGCGLVHVPTREELELGIFFPEKIGKEVIDWEDPGPFLLQKSIEQLLLGTEEIIQRVVKPIGTAAHVSLPRKYLNKKVTVIIWQNEENLPSE